MNDFDFLFTAAEVAVALAGFAGLVTVISSRLNARSAVQAHLLLSMLLLSMMVVGFSLLPYLCFRLGAALDTAWRVSSGAFFLGWLIYYIAAWRRVIQVRSGVAVRSGVLRIIFLINVVMHIVTGVVLLAGASGIWGDATAGFYLLGIAAVLYSAGFLFVSLFLELLANEPAV